MDKLSKKIVLQKLTEDAGFGVEEKAEVQGSRDVAAELKLNRLLASARTSQAEAHSTVPNRDAMLADVTTRAQSERSYYRRRAIMLAVRKSWPVAATVLVAVVALMLGTIFGQSRTAWATTDGYIIECLLGFDDYFSGTVSDTSDHEIFRLEKMVEDWAEGVSYPATSTVEIVGYAHTKGSEPTYRAEIKIRLLGAQEEDANHLLSQLAGWEDITGLELYSDTWYYSEKYPDNHFPGRQIVINGVPYSYPMDFTEQELSDLKPYLRFFSDIKGVVYVAYLKINQHERFPLTDLTTITMGSNRELVITDYGPLPDKFKKLMPSWSESIYVYVTEFEMDEDFEPEELIEARMRSSQTYLKKEMEFYRVGNLSCPRLVFDLPGNNTGEAQRVAQKLKSTLLEWVADYPELIPSGGHNDLIQFKLVPDALEPRQWVVDIWRVDSLLNSLKSAFEDKGFEPTRSLAIVPSPWDISQTQARKGQLPSEKPPRFDMLLAYDLIDFSDEHGTDHRWVLDNLSPAEIQRCASTVEKMQVAFDNWLATYNADRNPADEVATFDPVFRAYSEVVSNVSVMTSLTGADLEQLIAALALPGVMEPRRVSLKSHTRLNPLGMVIRGQYISAYRFKEIKPEDALGSINPQELAQLEGAKEMVQQAHEAWMLEEGSAVSDSGFKVQAKLHLTTFGEVPMGFSIHTNLTPGDVLDSLLKVVTPTHCYKIESSEIHGYNAGPKSTTQEKRFKFPEGFYDKQIIRFPLLPHNEFNALIYDSLAELFNPALRNQQDAVLAKMKNALTVWNQANPPDASKDETPATLDYYEIDGLIRMVSVKCSRLNRETMESLGEALAVDGAPVYQYGMAYVNRHMNAEINALRGNPEAETETLYGASVFYNLIPQMYWGEELAHKVTEERKAWSVETAVVMTEIFNSWLGKHPGLEKQFELDTNNWARRPMQFSAQERNEQVRQVNLHIYTPNEGEGQALVEELIEAFSMLEGLDGPHTRLNRERDFPVAQ